MISKMVLLKTVIGPVTPAITSGCAPKTEKMNAGMKEANRTSSTPYFDVVSIRSSENAMPGRTLKLRSDIHVRQHEGMRTLYKM